MSNARLLLEHVDTGQRIMLAKRWSDAWIPNPTVPHSDVWGAPFYAEGPATTSRVWRLVYEDMEPETMPVPENKAERG